MTAPRVLVTGGAGFLGAALVRRLVADGMAVRVLDDASRGSFQRLADLEGQYEAVIGDTRDGALLRQAAAGCQWLFHLAAVNGTRLFYEQPQRVFDVAVRGTLAAAEAARDAGVERFILTSSSEVYHAPAVLPTPEDVPLTIPDPYNPRFSYAGGKIAAELIAIHYLAASSCVSLIVRPHNVYGPAMGFEHVIPELVGRLRELLPAEWRAQTGAERIRQAAAAAGGPAVTLPVQGTGEETRAFCFVEDAVAGLLCVARNGVDRTTYHLGRQEETSVIELAEALGQCLGCRVTVQPGAPAAGGPTRRCPRIARLAALGYESRISLAEGLRRTAPFYWDHPAPVRPA